MTQTAPVRILPASLAARSMVEEVLLSPKPGLVDALDNGAHPDMDLSLFLASAETVRPYLEEIERVTPSEGDSRSILEVIRPVGILAEQAMFKATGGVNTHKGQIFSLGICTAAAKRTPGGALCVLDEASRICSGISGELHISPGPADESVSNGQKAFQKYGSTGIRGEAERGFPSVRCHALPAYRRILACGGNREEAALEALMTLMTVAEDSNVLHRRGMEGLAILRSLAGEFLLSGGMLRKDAFSCLKEMNSLFIRENISPGGCADLLALTLFLSALEEDRG